MGRHGGGSSRGGGGGGRSRSGGGSSRRGRGSYRSSSTPFVGAFNRTYIDRRGRVRRHYTNDPDFGIKRPGGVGAWISFAFITLHMVGMFIGLSAALISVGEKVNGDRANIYILDQAELLSEYEEREILSLFESVYEKSGMPVALVTDTFNWRDRFESIEACSEYWYYTQTMDEDAMVVFFAVDYPIEYTDWEFDIYCGDETVKCLSDDLFYRLVESLRKAAYSRALCEALTLSFTTTIDEMGASRLVGVSILAIVPFLLICYSLFYFAILRGRRANKDALRYFQEHPESLSRAPMTAADVEASNRQTLVNGVPYNGE